MLQYILITVLALVLSLVIAGFAFNKTRPILAVTFGLTPLLIMQIAFYVHDHISLQACIKRACESAGQPANCVGPEWGCREGSGYVLAILTLTGMIQLIIYLLGLIPIWMVYSSKRRRERASSSP
ncbi:MAG: hypothetical protein ACOYYU_12380 [Chloroflexota bacterium]